MVRSAAHPSRPSDSEAGSERCNHGPRVSNHEDTAASVASLLRPHLFDFRIAWQIIRAFAIDGIHHHALAVLQRGFADEGAERRLVIDLAEGDLAKWRRQRDAFG